MFYINSSHPYNTPEGKILLFHLFYRNREVKQLTEAHTALRGQKPGLVLLIAMLKLDLTILLRSGVKCQVSKKDRIN